MDSSSSSLVSLGYHVENVKQRNAKVSIPDKAISIPQLHQKIIDDPKGKNIPKFSKKMKKALEMDVRIDIAPGGLYYVASISSKKKSSPPPSSTKSITAELLNSYVDVILKSNVGVFIPEGAVSIEEMKGLIAKSSSKSDAKKMILGLTSHAELHALPKGAPTYLAPKNPAISSNKSAAASGGGGSHQGTPTIQGGGGLKDCSGPGKRGAATSSIGKAVISTTFLLLARNPPPSSIYPCPQTQSHNNIEFYGMHFNTNESERLTD
jgi:hypothetical protein